jgi:hypothetical protein
MSDMAERGPWRGMVPPQVLFGRRELLGVALEPPDEQPGSWIGAGKALRDPDNGDILLTARPRKAAGGVRGYSADIYRSRDGLHFERAGGVTREQAAALGGLAIHSIEGTQLLRDPLTGKWHFYLSVDTGGSFVWGGIQWETLLLAADSLAGPWVSRGIVLAHDRDYDANQARDSSIDIVDGLWICVYKAMNGKREVRPALATSTDGIAWRKHGPLTVGGEDHLGFLSGSTFAGGSGLVFVGLESSLADYLTRDPDVVYADEHGIGHGSSDTFGVAYLLDIGRHDLVTVYHQFWESRSTYEHTRYPLLGYSSALFDHENRRFLMYVEAIDGRLTKRIGLNETVERLLVYQTRLP